jgi:hypothetical protein
VDFQPVNRLQIRHSILGIHGAVPHAVAELQ